jgi:hypothetical protein
MTRTFASAVAVASLLTLPQWAAAQDPASSIVGVWKWTGVVTKEVASGKTSHSLGEGPIGYSIYTRGGHIVFVATAANRKAPAPGGTGYIPGTTPIPTDAERIELFKTAVFGSGTYRLEGNKLIQRYDTSWNQTWTGTERVWTVEITDKTLTMTSIPFKSSASGLDIVINLTYERVE